MSYHVSIIRTSAGVSDPILGEEFEASLALRGAVIKTEQAGRKTEYVVDVGEGGSAWLMLQDGYAWTQNPEQQT